jgi:hypothetical protein
MVAPFTHLRNLPERMETTVLPHAGDEFGSIRETLNLRFGGSGYRITFAQITPFPTSVVRSLVILGVHPHIWSFMTFHEPFKQYLKGLYNGQFRLQIIPAVISTFQNKTIRHKIAVSNYNYSNSKSLSIT